jgi:hypothetical protein
MKKIIIFSFLIFFPFCTFSSTTTFPEEEAGISAYTSTDDINEENNVAKINEAVAFFESLGSGMLVENKSTHAIGKIPIKIEIEGVSFNVYPYVYIDTEGWIVAYFHKNDPSSKIIQWTNYSPAGISSSTLEDALEMITAELDLSYSSVSYYHFQHKEATRMTVIIDSVISSESSVNNFSVTIPGTIYEASYSLSYNKKMPNYEFCPIKLSVDGDTIYEKKDMLSQWDWCQGREFIYGFYPTDTFTEKIPHSVVLEDSAKKTVRQSAGTVIFYAN